MTDDSSHTAAHTTVGRSPSRWRMIAITAGITAAITAAMMALSSATGGFASNQLAEEAQVATSRWTVPIVLHLATVVPALVLGGIMLARRKGDRPHRLMGRAYAALMVATALSSFWIGRPGTGIAGSGYSFIHIFSVWTLICIPWAIHTARTGNIQSHKGIMTGLYVGLVVAGLFTMIPGRLLGDLVF